MAPKKKTTKGNSLGPKAKSLFDHINQIREVQDPNYYKSLSDLDKKSWNNYKICRFLSMQESNIDMINEIQKYQTLAPEYFYQLCIAVVPSGRGYFPYVKGVKDTKFTEELLTLFRNHFEESKRNVLDYLSILTKQEIKSTVLLYGYTEEEADKIISS